MLEKETPRDQESESASRRPGMSLWPEILIATGVVGLLLTTNGLPWIGPNPPDQLLDQYPAVEETLDS